MKKRACISYIFFSLFVGLAAISVSAQSRGHLSANVPFDFQVGSRTLPAGEYTIRQLSSSNEGVLNIGDGRKQSTLALSRVVEANRNARRSRMVFHKYGERYLLASIWDNRGEGRILPQSADERGIRREIASTKKNVAPEIVVVELALK